MGRLSKTLYALGAAAVTGIVSVPAQAQAMQGEGLRFFITLTEQFAVAQVRNSPEFKKNPTQENGLRMFRDLYAHMADQHEAQQVELEARSEKMERKGMPNLEACHAASMSVDALIDRENLLRDYDGKVRTGQNPGPPLRTQLGVMRASQIIGRHNRALATACNRLVRE